MKNTGIVAIIWPKGESFTSLYNVFSMASAKIFLIIHEDVNPLTLDGTRVQDIMSSFEKDPKLSLIYGDEPNFVLVDSESLSIVLPVLRLNPPRDFRDLIKFFRDSLFCKDLYKTKRLPFRLGLMIGSESFRRTTDRERYKEQKQKEDQLGRIIEKLHSKDTKIAERILKELGEATIREIRASDDIDWQLDWIVKRLEKEGYSKKDLLS